MKVPTVTMTIESELSRQPLVRSFLYRMQAICGGHEMANKISR